jgi:hypothetical protein
MAPGVIISVCRSIVWCDPNAHHSQFRSTRLDVKPIKQCSGLDIAQNSRDDHPAKPAEARTRQLAAPGPIALTSAAVIKRATTNRSEPTNVNVKGQNYEGMRSDRRSFPTNPHTPQPSGFIHTLALIASR